jgi:hypothetical protein
VGAELNLFARAHNWKSYWASRILPVIAGDVLKVNAGIGSNTRFLDTRGSCGWVWLEPDSILIGRMAWNLKSGNNPGKCETVRGTPKSLQESERFDTIIYIDAFEHNEQDRQELAFAGAQLRDGVKFIVLALAHQNLYSPLDDAVGHRRRYDRAMLRKIAPLSLRPQQLKYLDFASFLLSTANRFLLRQQSPAQVQLRIWDKWAVPEWRVLDACFFNTLRRSILGVWQLEKGGKL